MALSLELRAAKLVAALEREGKRVAAVTISGDKITVTFTTDPVLDDAFDLTDYRR